MTGLFVSDVLGALYTTPDSNATDVITGNESYFPASFFESYSKRGLPFGWGKQTPKTVTTYLGQIKKQLPGEPGDLIWLMDRFFTDVLPTGGDIDTVPASVHNASIYGQIKAFCARAKYKHHPHLRTFMAFASMSEMGGDERLVPAIALTYVVKVLFSKFGKKNKTVNTKVNNESRSMTRVVLTIEGARQVGVMLDVDEPEPEQDIVIECDVTDDEAEEDKTHGQKRKLDHDHEYGADGESS